MSTDGDTFDEIEYGEPGPRISAAGAAQLLTYAAWLGAVAADYLLAPEGPALPWWDLTALDWLFVLALAVVGWNVVVPLARNGRRTRLYWRRFRRNRLAVLSLGYLAVVFVVGLVGPVVLREPSIAFPEKLLPPAGVTAAPQGEPVTGSLEHPLGTDHQGRDVLTLLVFGMRVSMEVGLLVAGIAVTVGTAVGTTAAHVGGYVDEALMRYVDLQQSFPVFILLLLVVYLFGPELVLIVFVYGFLSWEGTARLVRSEALQRQEAAYVRAAEAAGASRWWVVRRHLVPNVSSTVITNATLLVPAAILAEAGLAFLGLSDPNVYSWGKLIASGRGYLATAPWIATAPGVVLFLTALAFNFVGDALRDATDPRGD